MPTEIRWIASASASCFHAAEALAGGIPLSDAPLGEALAPAVAALLDGIQAAGLPDASFWLNLVALAAGIEDNRQLAARALTKTIGAGARQQQLAEEFPRLLTELEFVFNRARPGLVDELELRSAPLREQWEARGPGLLHIICKLTDPDFVVGQADVVLVHPALGGAGKAHIPYNSVRIEALLANPFPQLPEIARLGWLIAQLNLDLPMYQGELHRDRAAYLGSLALLPIVLTAGEPIELTRCDLETIQFALTAWDAAAESDAARIATELVSWWEVYRDSRPSWPVAIAALERMLTH